MFFVMFPIYGQTQKKDIITDNYFYPSATSAMATACTAGKSGRSPAANKKSSPRSPMVLATCSCRPAIRIPLSSGRSGSIKTTILARRIPSRCARPFRCSPKSVRRCAIKRPCSGRCSRGWMIAACAITNGKARGPSSSLRAAKANTPRVSGRFLANHARSRKNPEQVRTLESDSYLWPLYRYKHYHSAPWDQQRTSIVFYLFVDVLEKNTDSGERKEWHELWPLYHWRHDFNGNERLQILAPFEVVLPTNRGLERNWSPLWSLWVSEKNPATHADSQSLLWNLYRHESAPGHKKTSLLFGLFQYQKEGGNHRTRLFYLTISRNHPAAK